MVSTSQVTLESMVSLFQQEDIAQANNLFENLRQQEFDYSFANQTTNVQTCAQTVLTVFNQLKMRKIPVSALSPEERHTFEEASTIIMIANKKMLELHNLYYQTSPEYKRQYFNFFRRQLNPYYPIFQENTENVPFFRGMQEMDSDTQKIIDPSRCFKESTTNAVFSLLKRHHNGTGLVLPRIYDPFFVTPEERADKRLGWTAGVTAYSHDISRAALFSIGALSNVELEARKGRFDGYIYISIPERYFSMSEHLYKDLTDAETGNARSAYEICSCDMVGERSPIAIKIKQDGTILPPRFNELSSYAASVQSYASKPDGEPLSLLIGEHHLTNIFELRDYLKDRAPIPRIQDFETSLAVDFRDHATRVNKKIWTAAQPTSVK